MSKSTKQQFIEILGKAIEVENDPNAKTKQELMVDTNYTAHQLETRLRRAVEKGLLIPCKKHVVNQLSGRVVTVNAWKVAEETPRTTTDDNETPRTKGKKK